MRELFRRCAAVGAIVLAVQSLAAGQRPTGRSRTEEPVPGVSVPYDPDRDGSHYDYPNEDAGVRRRQLDKWAPEGKWEKLLAPSEEDRRRFAAFLRGKDTGLVRLFPYAGQRDEGLTVTATTSPLVGVWGGGGFYSFTHRTHVSGQWTELLLTERGLSAAVSRDAIGIVANLGAAPLESLTPESPGIAPLAGYAPKRDRAEAEREATRVRNGFRDGAFEYASTRPVEPGSTYVLRSVLYGRVDSLVAFRVVSRADDGSVTLLWRRLRKYDTPELPKAPRTP